MLILFLSGLKYLKLFILGNGICIYDVILIRNLNFMFLSF